MPRTYRRADLPKRFEGFNLDNDLEITTEDSTAEDIDYDISSIGTIRVIFIADKNKSHGNKGKVVVTVGGQTVEFSTANFPETSTNEKGMEMAYLRGADCTDNKVGYATTAGTPSGEDFENESVFLDAVEYA